MKNSLMAMLVLVVVAAIGGLMLVRNRAAELAATQKLTWDERTVAKQQLAPLPSVPSSVPRAASNSVTLSEPDTPAPSPRNTETNVSPAKIARAKPGKAPKPEIQDPTARVALSLVGVDPEAESYWASAINDPSLPANERQDLIEDLNEDGLSDPHHPTLEDMPLIASRIQLLEEMAPYAMDKVNADAFQEAYKDLVNLLNGGKAD